MPEQTKDDIVKDAILKAAARVFQKWGLNKTTMEDIAHEAGKGKSTLYYYYDSKEEIFDIVVLNEFDGVLTKAKTATIGIESAKDQMRTYIVTALHEIKKSTSVYSIVRGEIKGNAAFIEKLRKQLDSRETQLVKEILLHGMTNNEFAFSDEAELDTAAQVVVGILRALEMYLFLENEDAERIDIAAKLIANGI